ncbi:hypothetical protein HanIR_Chr02g0083561 [Helianthus annuus]|nr:hypothetical protein HanIR_Chr02g0083561 [Helianthus annuus]
MQFKIKIPRRKFGMIMRNVKYARKMVRCCRHSKLASRKEENGNQECQICQAF